MLFSSADQISMSSWSVTISENTARINRRTAIMQKYKFGKCAHDKYCSDSFWRGHDAVSWRIVINADFARMVSSLTNPSNMLDLQANKNRNGAKPKAQRTNRFPILPFKRILLKIYLIKRSSISRRYCTTMLR